MADAASRRVRAERAAAPGADPSADAAGHRLESRLRLLEALLGLNGLGESARQGLEWLDTAVLIPQSLLLVPAASGRSLVTAGWHGMPASAVSSFVIDLDDHASPLAEVVLTGQPRFFASGRAVEEGQRPATPLGRAPFHAVPLSPDPRSPRVAGLLLLATGPTLGPDVEWFTSVMSRKVGQLTALADAQVRLERDRLTLVIDSVADPIVVTDAAGETALMNAPAERLFVSPPTPKETSRRAVQWNHAQFGAFVAGLRAHTDDRRAGEVQLIDPATGDPLPVEAIAVRVRSGFEASAVVVTILHDRKEALENARLYAQLRDASAALERRVQAATADIAMQNELLRRQALELEQASMLKSQFLANMSHEFRTPLNAILGYTSMLLQGVAGPIEGAARRQLGRIESNGRHLLTVINEILDISRIEAGRMPLQVSRFAIPDLVHEVRGELEPIIARSKLTVTLDLPPDLEPISSDRQKVKQILLNLLGNALKFTHEGTVTVSARNRPADDKVELSVADTGIGIAPPDQVRIFEDFRQLDNSPTRAYGGTGLGLSICKRLAAMLDGAISVQSEVGAGSRFTLTLPAQGPR